MERPTIWETMAASAKDGKAVEVQILEQLIEMNRRLERLERALGGGAIQPTDGQHDVPHAA